MMPNVASAKKRQSQNFLNCSLSNTVKESRATLPDFLCYWRIVCDKRNPLRMRNELIYSSFSDKLLEFMTNDLYHSLLIYCTIVSEFIFTNSYIDIGWRMYYEKVLAILIYNGAFISVCLQ